VLVGDGTNQHRSGRSRAIIGTDSQAIHVTARPQEVKNAVCSARKARDLLGYRSTPTLDTGLDDIVNYIRTVRPRKFRDHLHIKILTIGPRMWTERLM
jgi:UDP-glucose 4-epimerase